MLYMVVIEVFCLDQRKIEKISYQLTVRLRRCQSHSEDLKLLSFCNEVRGNDTLKEI